MTGQFRFMLCFALCFRNDSLGKSGIIGEGFLGEELYRCWRQKRESKWGWSVLKKTHSLSTRDSV